ncbi:response regulator [Occallatibacter savannae]|uniref:response regulator n=1 Tax=Occallatibacter savannae TaxID=1002691 RepID=UPI001EF463AB|nr:response regulator [Occallatibacter savannae]
MLVVDDEHLVADSLCQILNSFGFNAYCAYSGPHAIRLATSAPFDALITDVVMTGMTGIETALEIWKILPKCKVMLVSGHQGTADLLKAAQERGHDFEIFAKPVYPALIIEKLRAITPAILQ